MVQRVSAWLALELASMRAVLRRHDRRLVVYVIDAAIMTKERIATDDMTSVRVKPARFVAMVTGVYMMPLNSTV